MTFELDTIETTVDDPTVQKLLAMIEEALEKYLTPYLFDTRCRIVMADDYVTFEVMPTKPVEFINLKTNVTDGVITFE
jgi:hypothetical protein